MSGSHFSLAILCIACFSSYAGEPSPMKVADQRDFKDSANGCAPATILNLLRSGGPEFRPLLDSLVGSDDGVKMRFLVDRYYRNRPSSTDRTRPRWGVHGIECDDLVDGLGELFAEHGIAPLKGAYLDRIEGEEEIDHLARVRRMMKNSLEAGTPPVLSLRSFLVKRREENDGNPHWESGINHYVLVTAVRGEGAEIGFEVEVIDPWRGRRGVLYLHREANGRAFLALKGNAESGSWLDGRPFLQVLAPDVPTLQPRHLEWPDRYIVVANHLVGRL